MRCMPANPSENAAQLNGLPRLEPVLPGMGRRRYGCLQRLCLELCRAGLAGDLWQLFMAYIEHGKYI